MQLGFSARILSSDPLSDGGPWGAPVHKMLVVVDVAWARPLLRPHRLELRVDRVDRLADRIKAGDVLLLHPSEHFGTWVE